MNNQPLLFLPKNFDALERNIEILKKRLMDVSSEAGVIAHQSSETWHDNYGFEEADRERRRITSELDKLLDIRSRAKVINPPRSSESVSIGTSVTIKNIGTGEERVILVGSYMVLEKTDPNEFSYAAPLIAPLVGASVGDIVEVDIHGKLSHIQIIEIS